MSLLYEIENYLRRTGEAPTAFGRRVVNDPRLIGDLKRGREPRGPMMARVRAVLGECPR